MATITTKLPVETVKLGKRLGALLSGGEFIVLVGDLGGGKTQFTKGIAKGLGIKETIVSPTFTIERLYASPKNLYLHHFDFYRLEQADMEIESEIRDLARDDQNIIVIEWGKNIPGALPDEYLEIDFIYRGEEKRQINLKPRGVRYQKLIGGLK